MRTYDVAIGVRVTGDDRPGTITDLDPEDPGHEIRVDWDGGGWEWVSAASLELEGVES